MPSMPACLTDDLIRKDRTRCCAYHGQSSGIEEDGTQATALIHAAKAVHHLPVQQGNAKLLPDPLSLLPLGVNICILLVG